MITYYTSFLQFLQICGESGKAECKIKVKNLKSKKNAFADLKNYLQCGLDKKVLLDRKKTIAFLLHVDLYAPSFKVNSFLTLLSVNVR